MAASGRQKGRTIRALWALALTICVLAAPALAQTPQDDRPQPVQTGSAGAGRVPVDGIPDSLSDALKRLQREEPVPETLFEARRQAERAAQVVSTFLESEGYYQATVTSFADGQDTYTRGVRVTPGPLFVYASVRIGYAGAQPDDATREALDNLIAPIATGRPARAEPVIAIGDQLVARLRASGYPDAAADPVDALADAKTGTVDLEFRLRPGLRASFGGLAVAGLAATRDDFVASLRPWKDGDLVTPARMDEYRSRLIETGLFSSTSVKLADAAPDGADGAARDVDVVVKERERHTIAFGASASTSDGVGADAEWQLRNYTGWGDTITIAGQLATLQRRISLGYRLPHIGKYGRILNVKGEVEDFSTDAFEQSGANLSASLEDQLSPRVRGAIGAEIGVARTLEAADRALDLPRQRVFILSGSASAEYVGVRDILDPTNGVRARISIEPGYTWGDTNILFAKISSEAAAYSDFGLEDFVFAVRGRLGTIAGPDGAPPDRLFFAGGGGSVRGYEYQSLSPRQPSLSDPTVTVPSGGRSLVEVSGEVRYRATDTLGYVAFLDAGAAGSNVEPPIDAMRFGAGVGVRYYTAFGPLRADIAVPLNKKAGDADFQVYISIGQAF